MTQDQRDKKIVDFDVHLKQSALNKSYLGGQILQALASTIRYFNVEQSLLATYSMHRSDIPGISLFSFDSGSELENFVSGENVTISITSYNPNDKGNFVVYIEPLIFTKEYERISCRTVKKTFDNPNDMNEVFKRMYHELRNIPS